MKRISLFIIISILMTSYVSQAQNIQGSWHGELDLVSQKLALVFHFDKDKTGKDLVKLDIPAQSAIGVPVAIQYLSKDSGFKKCERLLILFPAIKKLMAIAIKLLTRAESSLLRIFSLFSRNS